MATRPTTKPTWADDASASITNPGSVKQALGWVWKERPPHGFMNWWQNLVGQWFDWLDSQGMGQYSDFGDLLADTQVGRAAFLLPAAGDPWQKVWSKTELELGGAGNSLAAVATDGVRVYSATVPTTNAYLKAFDADDGSELWSVSLPSSVSTLFLRCDAGYLIHGANDGGALSVRVHNVETGAQINVISAPNLVDAFSDGDQLYVASTTTLTAYSDYGAGFGSEVTEWTDTPATPNFGNLVKVVTNGHLVFLGTVRGTLSSLKVYERDGTVVGVDDVNAYGNVYTQILDLAVDEETLFVVVDGTMERTFCYPVVQIESGDRTWPAPIVNWNQAFDFGKFTSVQSMLDRLGGVNRQYVVTRQSAVFGLIRVVKMPSTMTNSPPSPTDGEGGGPVMVFSDNWDDSTSPALMTDSVLCSRYLVYGGEENQSGEALVCRLQPQKGGKLLTRVDPTNFRRAPLFNFVKEAT